MGNKKICDSILCEILSEFDNLSADTVAHIEKCESCKAEFEKIQQMNILLKSSAPAVPSLKDSVLERIKDENITPTPISAYGRKHFPIGTLTAAAAVLAVGLLVYKGDILDKVDKAQNDNAFITYDVAYPETISAPYEQDLTSDKVLLKAHGAPSGNAVADEEAVTEETAETEVWDAAEIQNEAESVTETESAENPQNTAREDVTNAATEPTEGASNGTAEKAEETHHSPTNAGTLLALNPLQEAANSLQNDAELDVLPTEEQEDVTSYDTASSGGGTASKGGGTASSGGATASDGIATTSPISKSDYVKSLLGEITQDSNPEKIYKQLYEHYPDRISPDVFKNADPKEYLDFVMSIDDFDTEYTEDNFLQFCEKIFFAPYKMTEII